MEVNHEEPIPEELCDFYISDHIAGIEISSIDVVFIGGGPVGLWTAVQLKLLNPSSNIIILEKNSQYKRNHVLRLKKKSIYTPTHDPYLIGITRDWGRVVRTNKLEKDLYEYSQTLGIHMVNFRVTEDIDLSSMFPKCKAFIGSDGFHSICRKSFFQTEEFSYQHVLQHNAFLKYEVIGPTRPLTLITEIYPTFKLTKNILKEHVGKYDMSRDCTPITLQIAINESEYEPLKEARFYSPMTISNDWNKIPDTLRDTINIWLNVRKQRTGETRIESSEMITAIPLQMYRSRVIADVIDEKAYFLVGDAAFGVPYFRALNNGFLCGTELAQRISNILSENAIDIEVEKYNKFLKKLSDKEFLNAKLKREGLVLLDGFKKYMSIVPSFLQINKWSSKKAKQFKKSIQEYKD
jgi:2-polyprenyl-6-methoxyphenol hydroxylase-like FAD-dependent oxidoreductase